MKQVLHSGLLSERKAAAAIGISQFTLRAWRVGREIPDEVYWEKKGVTGRATVRYDLARLRSWLGIVDGV